MGCRVVEGMEIVRGGVEDYKRLGRFHYRGGKVGANSDIFSMRRGGEVVGVIVYRMPSMSVELRNVATGGIFTGFGRGTGLRLVNNNVRCISRVVIEPRFRGLGLASRLVSQTMGKVGVKIVEAMAVMGRVNPFFEKAGMKCYRGSRQGSVERMVEAFSAIGVEREDLIDEGGVKERIGGLDSDKRDFIEREIGLFLLGYGRSRHLEGMEKRVSFVLSKLGERPLYYIWFNDDVDFVF